jgi:small nuclear ribonucleoprotein (snRNP)-like protein
MGKRQQRIEVYRQTINWKAYINKEFHVVCSNGAVYHGKLEQFDADNIYIRDVLGKRVTLSIDHLQEIILDFVTE